MISYPKIEIKNVKPLAEKNLLVTFSNNIQKIYNCSPLLNDEAFKPLLNEYIFKSVKPDSFGYGIMWSDTIDLSESELWINGLQVE